MFGLKLESTVGRGVGKGEKFIALTPPPLFFDQGKPPSVQISFSPHSSTAVKIIDGSYNFPPR